MPFKRSSRQTKKTLPTTRTFQKSLKSRKNNKVSRKPRQYKQNMGQIMKSIPKSQRPLSPFASMTPEEKCVDCAARGSYVFNHETPLELYQSLGLL